MEHNIMKLLFLSIFLATCLASVTKQTEKSKELKQTKSVHMERFLKDTDQNDDDSPPEVHCDLGVRPYPFVYYGQTKTLEFRVLFLSSCLDFPLLYYFTLPYNQKYKLYAHTHPSFIRLKLFGRVYDFKFTEAYERYNCFQYNRKKNYFSRN